jgi:uncharacterized protein (TIRG00374 family)
VFLGIRADFLNEAESLTIVDNHTSRSFRLSPAVRSRIVLGVTLSVFVAGGLLLIYLLRDIDWTLVRQTGLPYLVLILLLSALSILVYVAVVYLLVRTSGCSTTFVQAYLVLTASLSANYVTPIKVGIPLRIYLYNHFMQIPLATGFALITVEAVLGMALPALIALVGVATLFPAVEVAMPLVLIGLLGAGMVAILLIRYDRLSPLLHHLPFQRLIVRIGRFVERVQTSLHSVPPLAVIGVALLILLMLILQALRLHVVLRAFGYPVSPLALFCVLGISVTAGNLSLIPMGIGVRDASLVLLLRQFGIPDEIVLSTAVIERLFAPGLPLLLGLISTNVLGVTELVKRSDKSSV